MLNDENGSVETAAVHLHDVPSYELGDLVWAKVKSHPWWPGQVFNAIYASDQAKSLEKAGRILVAFYGDHTFAWLEHCQLLKFKPNFEEKAIVTNTQNFQCAISEALDEVCRRAQLGLQCQCRKSLLDSEHTSSGLDDGIQGTHEGLRLHKDVLTSKVTLNSRRTLSFLKDLASSPCNHCSSNVNASVLYGHLLGIRTGIFADTGKDGILEEGLFGSSGKHETVFDSTTRAVNGSSGVQSQVECRKCGNTGDNKRIFPLEECERDKRWHVARLEVDNEETERESNPRGAGGQTMFSENGVYGTSGSCNKAGDQQRNTSLELSRERICFFRAKLELRGQNRGSTPSLNELSSFCDDKATQFLMQSSEALQFVAIDPLCHHGSYDTVATMMAVFLKFRDLVFQKSAGYGYHLQSSGQRETQVKDAPHIGISAVEHDGPPKAVRYWRPTSQKQRTLDPHYNQLENLETLNITKAQPHLQCVASTVACHTLSSDTEGTVLGMNFEGVSQAHSQPQETVLSQKLDVHELLIEAHRKTSRITNEAPAKLDVHKLLIGAHKRKSDFTKGTDKHELKMNSECAKEAPAKVLKKALETSAVGGDVYSEVHSDVRMDAEQHLEIRSQGL